MRFRTQALIGFLFLVLTPSHLWAYGYEQNPGELSLAELEHRHIGQVLAGKRGNKARTAQALGISLKTLYNKIKEYNITT